MGVIHNAKNYYRHHGFKQTAKKSLKKLFWNKPIKTCAKIAYNILFKFPYKIYRSITDRRLKQFITDFYQSTSKPESTYKDFETKTQKSHKTKFICFYLPQFHPFKENDDFWGTGFTEWTNVTKAIPHFKGHYQPRLPTDLGFYDLRLDENIEHQAKILNNYGIHGLCIHYYWFSGKQVMETPIEKIYANKNLNLNYSICWANENWTRRWDGQEKDVLLEQLHKPSDYLDFIKNISKFLQDPRYIKVNGCPLLVVYRAELLNNPREATRVWRKYVKEELGMPDLHLILTHSFHPNHPQEFGFDAAVDFPPNSYEVKNIVSYKKKYFSDFTGRIIDYREVMEFSLKKKFDYPFYHNTCLDWDNTARRGSNGTIMSYFTPRLFKTWLVELIKRKPLNDIIFINAWNEWAEGTYLEPDRKYGYSNLNACYEALETEKND